jgi:hypothetical protein
MQQPVLFRYSHAWVLLLHMVAVQGNPLGAQSVVHEQYPEEDDVEVVEVVVPKEVSGVDAVVSGVVGVVVGDVETPVGSDTVGEVVVGESAVFAKEDTDDKSKDEADEDDADKDEPTDRK